MTFSTNGVTADFMLALRLARINYAEYTGSYDAECAADAEAGYRSHYCIHGTNQWTDYDNICAGCEDGVTMLNMAVRDAGNSVVLMRERMEWAVKAPHWLTPEVRKEIWEWVMEPVSRYSKD